ncbi:MAG: arginine repressor [Clostridia bacterium]|nr:arginine repressor [Clostridia bacterium]
MKNIRQSKILQIIEQFEIGTQEELIKKLAEFGVEATQTTISRDIRQLKLIKGPTGRGTYKYVCPEEKKSAPAPVHSAALGDAVVKVEEAQNIVVIKTLAGMANAIAVCVDTMSIHGIVGSVAGDDTVLLVFKTSELAYSAARELGAIFLA